MANTVAENETLLQEALVPSTALQCADKPLPRPGEINRWPRVVDRFREQNGVVEAWWLWAPCASWRTASANRYTGPWNATTPNPILVIGNRYDPRTVYANAVVAARRLGNAVLLTNNGYGHTSSSDLSDCTIEAVGRYLTKLAKPTRRVCQPNHRPFDPDFGQ